VENLAKEDFGKGSEEKLSLFEEILNFLTWNTFNLSSYYLGPSSIPRN